MAIFASMVEGIERLKSALTDRYHIKREIGSGGMATVYSAQDLKHNRQVAVKVLKPSLSEVLGAERFLKEIELTANLQHPNILPVYDSGNEAGLLFYVMPYIEGESLRQRLNREKQLPLDDALGISRAVGAALHFAHEKGVVHRDIKPENILLQAGQPLVADFGIALAVTEAGGTRLTETSVAVGTPRYMSPEQAMAEESIDGRSDVFSLACVLYEMLAGDPPHTGSSSQAVFTSILTDQPRPIIELRRAVPGHINDTLEIALSKLAADRFSTAQEFCDCLDGRPHPLLATLARERGVGSVPGRVWIKDRRTLGVIGVVFAMLVLVMVATMTRTRREPRLWRIQVVPPDSTELVFLTSSPWGDTRRTIALSPDGRFLAFVARGDGTAILWVRDLENGDLRSLTGTENAYQPVFSPDNSELAFFSGSLLKKVPISGGSVQDVGEFAVPFGAVWAEDGGFIVSDAGLGIARVSSGGRPPEVLNPGSTFDRCVAPQLVGVGILCSSPWGLPFVASAEADTSWALEVVGEDPGELEAQLWGSSCAVALGDRIFCTDPSGTVRTARLLEGGRKVEARSTVVAEGVRTEQALAPNAQVTISANGVMAFVKGSSAALTRLVRDSPAGVLDTLEFPTDRYGAIQMRSDGRRIAVVRQAFGLSELRILDTESGQSFTSFSTDVESGIRWFGWLPEDTGLWIAVGTGEDTYTVVIYPETTRLPDTIARGISASYVDLRDSVLVAEEGGDVVLLPLSNTGEVGESLARVGGVGGQSRGALSPDHHWMAFNSDESGVLEVFVQELTEGGRRLKISREDGYEPGWLLDGSIVYRASEGVYRVPPVANGFGPQEFLSSLPGFVDTPGFSFATDGLGRVAFVQMMSPPTGSRIELVTSVLPLLR